MSLAYTFTIGPGKLSKEGLYLLNSIRENTEAEKDEIFVYIVDDEREEIKDELIQEIEEKATIVEGEMPNTSYPLSAAHGALLKTSQVTDKDYIVLLDTDTLVLDDITIHKENDAELFIAPETLSHKYWASTENSETFKKVFEEYGFDYPDENLESNYDRKKINPLYNSGVILTKNNDFPEKYVELSKEIHGNLPNKNYFSDMVSLSLLASEYNVCELPPQYNFFQAHRPYPQEGTKIVHYVEIRSLNRGVYLSEKIGSGWFKSKIEKTGVIEDYRSSNKILRSINLILESNYAYTRRIKGKELVNYKIRKKFIRILEITKTKQLARDIANWMLGEKRFKDEDY